MVFQLQVFIFYVLLKCTYVCIYFLWMCDLLFMHLLHFVLQRIRCHLDPEYAESSMSETIKDEAAFEDKMVDVMVLEDPQNMYQALDKSVN